MDYNVSDKIILKNGDIAVSGTYGTDWSKNKMIDGNTSNGGWQPTGTGVDSWASFNLNRNVKRVLLRIFFHGNNTAFYPKEMIIQGDDGGNWIDETKLSIDNSNKEWHEFKVNFSRVYSKIRLYIVSTYGQRPVLREVEIYDVSPINKTLILHEGEYKKWNPKVDVYNDFKLKMTSNTTPAPYVASASSVYSTGYPAWKAFDGVTEKPSTSANLWTGEANKFPYWMSINFGESKNFNYLKVYYSTDGNELARIKSCIVQGSSDGAIWEDIKSFPSVSNANNNVTLYFQENKKSFNHYRLYMLENYGFERITLAQLVYGFKNDIDLLSIGWKDIQLSNIQTEGMDSLSPLLDRRVETLDPLEMIDKSDILSGEIGKVFSRTIDLGKYIDLKSMKVEVE